MSDSGPASAIAPKGRRAIRPITPASSRAPSSAALCGRPPLRDDPLPRFARGHQQDLSPRFCLCADTAMPRPRSMRGAWCASAHSPPASCADRQSFIPGDRDHGVSRQWRYSGACAIDGRWVAFGPAGPVPANGPTAMRLLQSTCALRLSGCISPIPCGSGMGNGKTWPRPSPSSICAVGSAVLAPILSALDLETALITDDA